MLTYPQFKLLLTLRNYVDAERCAYGVYTQADRARMEADELLLKNIDTKLRILAKQALLECDVTVPDHALQPRRY